jgi:hypothetical protein
VELLLLFASLCLVEVMLFSFGLVVDPFVMWSPVGPWCLFVPFWSCRSLYQSLLYLNKKSVRHNLLSICFFTVGGGGDDPHLHSLFFPPLSSAIPTTPTLIIDLGHSGLMEVKEVGQASTTHVLVRGSLCRQRETA